MEAGCTLLERNPSWDWRDVTFRGIATETGLSERTVYRYFASEDDLHEAIMGRLAQKSGASLEPSTLGDIVANTVRFLSWYVQHAVPAEADTAASTAGAEAKRPSSLEEIVGAAAPTWTRSDRRSAAAVLDLLTNVRAYESFLRSWGMSQRETTEAAAWLLDLVVDAIGQSHSPSSAGRHLSS